MDQLSLITKRSVHLRLRNLAVTTHSRVLLLLLFIYFKLEDNCFTILGWFLPYINMNQSQVYILHPTLKTWLQIPWHSSPQEVVSISPPLEPRQAPNWVSQQNMLSDALWSLMLNHRRLFGLCLVGWNPRLEAWGCRTLQGSSKYRKRLMCTSSAQQTQRSPLSGHPSPGISGELLQKPPNDASPQPFKTFQSKDSEDSTSFI